MNEPEWKVGDRAELGRLPKNAYKKHQEGMEVQVLITHSNGDVEVHVIGTGTDRRCRVHELRPLREVRTKAGRVKRGGGRAS